jgi:hypothetical protein
MPRPSAMPLGLHPVRLVFEVDLAGYPGRRYWRISYPTASADHSSALPGSSARGQSTGVIPTVRTTANGRADQVPASVSLGCHPEHPRTTEHQRSATGGNAEFSSRAELSRSRSQRLKIAVSAVRLCPSPLTSMGRPRLQSQPVHGAALPREGGHQPGPPGWHGSALASCTVECIRLPAHVLVAAG